MLRPEGSAALCPRELDPLERDYFRLNPLENTLRVDLRPFPPRECLLWCCGCREGICGRCWRLSEAFQWGVGGVVPAHRCPAPGLGGVWMVGLLLCQVVRGRGTKRPGDGERFSWPERSEFPDTPAGDWWQWSTVHLGPLPERYPDIFSPGGALGPEGPGDESCALYIYTRGIFQKRKENN